MAIRKRSIDVHALLFDPELVNALGSNGLWMYALCWSLCDDFGGIEITAATLKLELGALQEKSKITLQHCQDFLNKIIEQQKFIPYTFNGKTYYWIKNFLKHQPLNNPAKPTIPVPEWIAVETFTYPKSNRKYAHYTILPDKIPQGVIINDGAVHNPNMITKIDKRNPEIQALIDYARERGFAIQGSAGENRKYAYNLLRKKDNAGNIMGMENLKKFIDDAVAVRGDQFAPVINDFKQLYYKFSDLMTYLERKKQGGRIG
jgi:hypothetical protein